MSIRNGADGKPLEQFITADQLQKRCAELGQEITEAYKERGDDLILLCVLKGSVIFLADLARHIDLPVSIDFIGISSYGDETRSSGVVKITSDITKPIEGKHVLVVEDIVDTGLTLHYLLDNLKTRHPASLQVCSLLHKPARTKVEISIDYLGFTIEDKFVIGYGLDLGQRYRNLPFIGVYSD